MIVYVLVYVDYIMIEINNAEYKRNLLHEVKDA